MFSLVFTGKWDKYSMSNSCNGLVGIYNEVGELQLLNPTTPERLSLPWPLLTTDRLCPSCMLGFCPATREYKVIWIHDLPLDRLGRGFAVLTVGTDCWKHVDIGDVDTIQDLQGAIVVDGVMYWINRREDKMFSFDLESEKLTVIPFLVATSGYTPRSPVELEGSFSFTFARDGVEIKVMDAASRVWVKKYGRVHLYCMVSPRNLDSASPLHPRQGKLLLAKSSGRVCWHHLRAAKEECHVIHANRRDSVACALVVSLVSFGGTR